MAEPFKNWINPGSIRGLGEQIRRVYPGFPLDAYQAAATDGLEALELKPRVAQVADALRDALPEAWPDALQVLVDALPDPMEDTEAVSSGFPLWPVLHCVEVHGLGHPAASVDALHPMTKRFSAEFAIRPYLDQHPDVAWGRVARWVTDPDVHVRRLCSEGTRPRLPWGIRLRDSVADPSRGLAVIERLVDDPEAYVRTSVANHLNDISKDHPELTVEVAGRWLAGGTEGRTWIVNRGLRTLVKQGHEGALSLLGFGAPRARLEAIGVSPDPAEIGAKVELSATVLADADQRYLVDWIVRAPRADGSLGHRVVKGKQVDVTKGQTVALTQRLSLKPVTTQVTRPGRWEVAIQVNGEVLGETAFEVVGEPA